jgi:hypothetical protein
VQATVDAMRRPFTGVLVLLALFSAAATARAESGGTAAPGAEEAAQEAAARKGKSGAQAEPVIVKRGDRGSAVRQVQTALGISADGVFGPQTEAAVERFQRRKDLTVDGVVGPETRDALGLEPFARSSVRRGSSGAKVPRILRLIAECESGGDPTAVSPGGQYRGKYQFSLSTWRALGGEGDPAAAPEAEQDRLALKLYRRAGTSPWPNCP